MKIHIKKTSRIILNRRTSKEAKVPPNSAEPNKRWMRDWMEQASFLRIEPDFLSGAENGMEDFYHYTNETKPFLNTNCSVN